MLLIAQFCEECVIFRQEYSGRVCVGLRGIAIFPLADMMPGDNDNRSRKGLEKNLFNF
jgi:hypothetical protein